MFERVRSGSVRGGTHLAYRKNSAPNWSRPKSGCAGRVARRVPGHPAGDIHRVRNIGDTTAISLHVYGADLSRVGSSVRRYYD